MSSLVRSYHGSRRHLLSRLIEQKPPPVAKRRFRSIALAVDQTERDYKVARNHSPWSLRCKVRFLTTRGRDDQTGSDSQFQTKEFSNSSFHPVSSLHDGDDDDRLPFESEPDDDSDSDSDEQEAEIAAEGMFDTTKASPLATLNTYYCNEYGLSSVSKHFHTEQINRQWFATFKCPETGFEYPQGTLRNHIFQGPSDASLPGGEISLGQPGYQKKSTAIHAAAARVLDMIQFEELRITEPRLCEEDPSLFHKPSVFDAKQRDDVETNVPVDVSDTVHTRSDHDHINESFSIGREENDTALRSREGEDEDDGGDYTVADIPTPSGVYEPSTRLLQAFSFGQDAFSTAAAASNIGSCRMPITTSPFQQLKIAIDIAKSWAEASAQLQEEIASNPHRMQLPIQPSSKSHLIGKALLAGLADAKHSFAVSSGWVGCEPAAWQILDVLWEHEETKPDTEAYNLLLKCLEGNPMVNAKKAEAIVNAMESGSLWRGKVLPKPDMDTINTLIQIWAQVGGSSGRYENVKPDFVPNRETFLSILSSCCYHAKVAGEEGGFDAAFAKECIRRMGELSLEHPEDLTLVPDVHVYNASLRWTGGSLAKQSRPYARPIPWDNFHQFYGEEGPLTFDPSDENVLAAQAIESWIDTMRDDGITPNLETYEALMQAWLRTGTRVGLDRSQTIAESLLEGSLDGITARLQTFRPLTLCWLFSREEDGSQKIQSLLDRLEAASVQSPQLRPDARLSMVLVAAYKNKAMKELSTKTMTVAELVEMGERCSSILTNLCNQLQSDIAEGVALETFLEIIHYVDSVDVWQYVAAAIIDKGAAESHSDSLRLALKERVRVIDLHDALIQSLLRAESSDGIGLRLRREYSFQLKHLLAKSGSLYSAFLLGTKKLCELQRQVDGDFNSGDLLIENLPLFERIVRRSGEMEIAASHDTELKRERLEPDAAGNEVPDQTFSEFVYYGDYFVGYRLRRLNNEASSRDVLLNQVVECLRTIDATESNIGDLARLLLLVKTTSKEGHVASAEPNVSSIDRLLRRLTGGHRKDATVHKHDDVYSSRTTKGRRRIRSPKTAGRVSRDSSGLSSRREPKKLENMNARTS